MEQYMKKIEVCRGCGSASLEQFFDLGMQPPANKLLKQGDEPEEKYPLSLAFCKACSLVQLEYTIDPQKLFSNYVWVTGTSCTAQQFADTFHTELVRREPLNKNDFILEIASNDGTFLKPFLHAGNRILGIDPAQNIADRANRDGIPTRCAFWTSEEAVRTVAEHGKARVIFARNVLPHVANTIDFVQGIETALADDGVAVIEVHYAPIIANELHYDSIYHEHLCYFTLKSLSVVLERAHLSIFDIVKSPISGGSIIVHAKRGAVSESVAVTQYRDEEAKSEINSIAVWKKFATRSAAHRDDFMRILSDRVQNHEVIVGWGASARSSTLLNFCGVEKGTIQAIADKNELKHNRYTAGTRIKIDTSAHVMALHPQLVCILAWNFADEIIRELQDVYQYRGTCLIPLPGAPRIISLSDAVR
jgi:hypothetical protein